MSSEFTVGCARWLYLTLGNDPQLTQMPIWYQPAYVGINLGRKDLRITTAEAKDAARILGLTHYALGTAEPGKLSFQVYELSGKALGAPIVLTGDEAAITAALPQAANAMRERLGLPAATIAPPVETPAELTLAGRVPFRPGDNITEEDAEGLRKLSQKSVLGGMLYFRTNLRAEKNPEGVSTRATRLAQLAGDNPIVFSEIVPFYPAPAIVATVQKLAAQYPKNAPLAAARAVTAPTREAQVAAAEDVVRNAPSNPDSWNLLAIKLRALAGDERRGRTADQISEEKWNKLNTIYGRSLAVIRYANQLDPRSANDALVLSQAALFAGAEEEAQKALETAFTLGAKRHRVSEIVSWALELNAPKWGGSQELLEKTANRVTKLPFVDVPEIISTMSVLEKKGYPAQAEALAKRVVAEAQKSSAANPKDSRAYEHQRIALTLLKRYPEALEATLQFVKLRPRDTDARIALAEAYQMADKPNEALTQAQEIVKFFPSIARTQILVAEILVQQKRFAEAVPPALAAAKLVPNTQTL
ncbi:hypothetical protein, partial [Armatimonas sp.]|uniref:hypothetical protein n=1 Tax=Armatimonas sp. TaxID=1872638 RepID=UPI00286A7805